MKKVVHIDFSWQRLMRDVEEQADYVGAKISPSEYYDKLMVTEADKKHLNTILSEAIVEFDALARDYRHELKEGEFVITMPMNYDDSSTVQLSVSIRKYFATFLLRQWMRYMGASGKEYDDAEFTEKLEGQKKNILVLLNRRQFMPLAFFESMRTEPGVGMRIEVQ